jgi:acyl-CoA reductase-like NAD-dependent aldehyde dehydrogenase
VRCVPASSTLTVTTQTTSRCLSAASKQSGMGRDKSLHAFDKYTELTTTWIDLS